MTIPTTIAASGPYLPNGATTAFPFSFKALSDTEITVALVSPNGTEEIVSSAAYDVTLAAGDDPGGTVTMFVAPVDDGRELWIYSDPTFLQEIKFEDEGAFNQSILNQLADEAGARLIWLRERVSRGFVMPRGEAGWVLPDSATRAGKYVGFEAGSGAPVLLSGVSAATDSLLVSANDAAAGTLFSSVQGFINRIMSSVGASIVGFVHDLAGAVVRSLQSKARDTVSPEDFGAVSVESGGAGDQKAALLLALTSGREVDGNGRTYNIAGNLGVTSLKGLRNIRFAQIATDTATVNYYVLSIIGASNFSLVNVEVAMSANITSLFNDDGAGGVYIGGVDKDTYATNFVIDNVRVTGNGCGTGIHIRHCKRFTVTNSQVRDRVSGSSPDPTNDSQNGFEFFNCADFSVHACQAYNLLTRLGGVSTLKWSRGFLAVECRDWIMTNCRAVNVDQGFDLSGGYDAVNGYIGNRRWVLANCIGNGCGTYAFKCANTTRDGLLIGCLAVNTGWLGYVFSPSSATLPGGLEKYNTSNIEVVGCKVLNSNGTSWSNPGSAGGYRLMSNGFYPSWPRGIRFRDCHAEDTQDVPVMTVAFNSDVAAIEYPNAGYDQDIANYLVDCTSRGIGNHASGIATMRALLTSTGTQTITNDTDTTLDWNADTDRAGLHSNVSNNSAVYIKTPGTYRIEALLRFAANATGFRRAWLQVNGVTVDRSTVECGGFASAETTLALSVTHDLKAGDNVIVRVRQNSGGDLTFKGNESRFTVSL